MVVLIETLNRVKTNHQPSEVGDTDQAKQTKEAKQGRQSVSQSITKVRTKQREALTINGTIHNTNEKEIDY